MIIRPIGIPSCMKPQLTEREGWPVVSKTPVNAGRRNALCEGSVSGFRLVDLQAHGDLLETARDDARYILEMDGNLETERGQALRMLLYIWRRDEAIRLLRAG